MPRAAGSNPNYDFVLRNANTGRYMQDVVISLPSSTTIIKQTLAAPQLVGWAYRTTRDNIAGLVDQLALMPDLRAEQIVDMLSDADWLEEYLKENKLRPDDIKDEAGGRGTKAHSLLERLAGYEDTEHAYKVALTIAEGRDIDPFDRAIATWWVETTPMVVASERILPCPQHGYCGTTDLVWYDGQEIVVSDLKTRRAGLYDYDSDQYQVDSYRTAYNLLNPANPATRGTVILAFDDGTYGEESVILEPGSFLKLKAVWDAGQTARQLDPQWGRGQ